jgi:nitrogen regulatory protein P-II 1
LTTRNGNGSIKKIEAIVRKERFPEIDKALKDAGISGLTFYDVDGRGRAKGREMLSDRGTRTFRPEYVGRTKLEILAKAKDVPKIIQSILSTAKTGAVGDGKIAVLNIEEMYDIPSGESGEKAV